MSQKATLALSLITSVAALAPLSTGCGGGTIDQPLEPAAADAPSSPSGDDASSATEGFEPSAEDASSSPDGSVASDSHVGSTPDSTAADSGTAPKPVDSGTAPPVDSSAPVDSGTKDTGAVDSAPKDTGLVDVVVPPPVSTIEYAPYFYSWGWGNSVYPFTSLVDMQKKAGVNGVTLAFVLAKSGTCAPSTGISSHVADINAFRAAGGAVKASFGGASGTYLEAVCPDATSLANAIGAFVDATNVRDLDFDVEQSGVMTSTVNTRRAQALAQVQASRGAKIAFTLAVDPSGLSSASLDVVKKALAAGVDISHVNLMVMDYGSGISSGHTMGALAISSIEAVRVQLKAAIPGLTDTRAYAMIGATPMIGQNDVSSEVFGIADAHTLIDYAKTRRLGLVSFWAIQRDQPCASGDTLDTCSVAGAPSYGFHNVFKGVLGP